MKTRTKIVTFTLAMVLVGSLAYAAADKRRQAKLPHLEPAPADEEEALKTELLAATEDRQESSPKTMVATSKKIVDRKEGATKETAKPTQHE